MRIAQIGTFDVDNLGDLLFPWVLRRLVGELAAELGEAVAVDAFSPVGCAAGVFYLDQEEALPLATYAERTAAEAYDLTLIGGGDIVRDDDWSLYGIYGPDSPPLTFSHIVSPDPRAGSPLALFAPGAPFDIDEDFGAYLGNSFTRLVCASARDRRTQGLLQRLVPASMRVELVPDMVSAIVGYLPAVECSRRARVLLEESGIGKRAYLCFQGHAAVCGNEVETAAFLRQLHERTGMPIVLLEVGACLGDTPFLERLSQECGFPLVTSVQQGRRIAMADKVAIVAASAGFVGSSLHGNIIARAYGLPHLSFVGAYSHKVREFFRTRTSGRLFADFVQMATQAAEVVAFLEAARDGADVRGATGEACAVREFLRRAITLAIERRERGVPAVQPAYRPDIDALYKRLHARYLGELGRRRRAETTALALGDERTEWRKEREMLTARIAELARQPELHEDWEEGSPDPRGANIRAPQYGGCG